MPRFSRTRTIAISFWAATRALEERGDAVVLAGSPIEFRASIGETEIAHPVRVVTHGLSWVEKPLRAATLGFRVEASWMPVFEGDLEVTAKDPGMVEAAVEGIYEVPGSIVGRLVDKMALHRVAEESLETFSDGIFARLEDEGRRFDAITGISG